MWKFQASAMIVFRHIESHYASVKMYQDKVFILTGGSLISGFAVVEAKLKEKSFSDWTTHLYVDEFEMCCFK